MNEAPISAFKHAIRATHGAEAELIERVQVHETFEGETVWEGEVLVFQLQGHSEAERRYCWEIDGQVTAVLEVPPVRSAADAVRASIVADEGEVPEGA